MPIYTMSKDVNELDAQHSKILDEIDIINNKSVNTMWIEGSDELLHYYKKNNL